MAWAFVGVSAAATVTGTPVTLAEPAGVADGDLLIACIACRTTSLTSIVNTGWTLVNEQKTNDIATTTSAIASGVMLYRIRSGVPDLTFTLPASGTSVAFGRMIAYRGNASTTPLDASTAVTTAINTLAVSVAGLTTTAADDLIVAMCAGGQEAAWSAFNATTPSGASGATDTTTAPSATWRERADSSTTTGADTSLAIFDAVKTAAGATGNLTATASLGAGHVVIAGAFKIAPPPPAGAIAFRALEAVNYANRTDPFTVNKPVGTVDGDIMIAVGLMLRTAANVGEKVIPPAGWTAIAANTTVADASTATGEFQCWWKRAASEGASYSFGLNSGGNRNTEVIIASYSGCIATGSPIDTFSTNSGTCDSATALSITTTVTNTLLIIADHNWDAVGNHVPPTGFTERQEFICTINDVEQVSAGASGNKTYTSGTTAGPNPWQSWMFALKPQEAVAGGGKPVKAWDGSAWVTKLTKVWNGSAWVTKPAKVWNGSAWV